MRHKWKNVNKKHYLKVDGDTVQYIVRNVRECIHCGLLKGNVSGINYYTMLVYFKNGKMLSKETLPFKCTEVPNGIFLSKKDFYIEG